MLRARGNLWAFGRDIAIAHAQRPKSSRNATSRGGSTKPVDTRTLNLLVNAHAHGQDVAVPLRSRFAW